jgi:hypothetical protein
MIRMCPGFGGRKFRVGIENIDLIVDLEQFCFSRICVAHQGRYSKHLQEHCKNVREKKPELSHDQTQIVAGAAQDCMHSIADKGVSGSRMYDALPGTASDQTLPRDVTAWEISTRVLICMSHGKLNTGKLESWMKVTPL